MKRSSKNETAAAASATNASAQHNFQKKEVKGIQTQLLNWFETDQRDLPWRRTYDPYHVWISEIMLQQTQVKTVLPYYARWMERLPTLQAVAEADDQVILKLWEGLGYYSRARNLHKAAQVIVEQHEGRFPNEYEAILALPGIGRYTAGAICSIAFNQEVPIVDGNIIRLISRLLDDDRNTRQPKVVKDFWTRAETLIPLGRAREFNQAMMEFGALRCTPKNPQCGTCPLQTHCRSFAEGTVAERPNRGPKQEKIHMTVAVAIIQKENKFFIQRRRHQGLMGGLWEFPGGKLQTGETPVDALHREIHEELNITLDQVEPLITIKHAYTKFKVELHSFLAQYKAGDLQLKAAIDSEWVELDRLPDFPFPAATVKLIEALKKREVQKPLF